MVINKSTIKKALLRTSTCFVFMFLVLSITSWKKFYDEFNIIFYGPLFSSFFIFLLSLAEFSDKERHRMELERQEKGKKKTEQQTNFSDDMDSKEV